MRRPTIEKFGTIYQSENGDMNFDGFHINFGDCDVNAENMVAAVKDYLDEQLKELDPVSAFGLPVVECTFSNDEVGTQSASNILDAIRESAK